MREYKRASTVLNKAADLLEAEGWVKGAMECKNGKHCAVGAIAAITGDLQPDPEADDLYALKSRVVQTKDLRPDLSPIFRSAIHYLGEHFEKGRRSVGYDLLISSYPDPQNRYHTDDCVSVVIDTNDADKMTRKKIVTALRKAAENAKAERN